MNIDIHSHFFPIEALRNAGKYQDKAPKILEENGRYTVISGGGKRGNLNEGAYNAVARIKDLDKMNIDMQAISPSPILLFLQRERAKRCCLEKTRPPSIPTPLSGCLGVWY